MDLFSQNCPCCDSAKVDIRTRYTTQNNGTHRIYHCRSCDIYFSDTFATPMAGLRTPLSRIIEILKARTLVGVSVATELQTTLSRPVFWTNFPDCL